jgi:hypothetical protein
VAITALTSPSHEGETYRISGPEALNVAERVDKLSAAPGRPQQLVEVPVQDIVTAATRTGRQPLVVETTLGNLARKKFRRQASQTLPTVQEVIGRPPRTPRRVGDRPHRHLPLTRRPTP